MADRARRIASWLRGNDAPMTDTETTVPSTDFLASTATLVCWSWALKADTILKMQAIATMEVRGNMVRVDAPRLRSAPTSVW